MSFPAHHPEVVGSNPTPLPSSIHISQVIISSNADLSLLQQAQFLDGIVMSRHLPADERSRDNATAKVVIKKVS